MKFAQHRFVYVFLIVAFLASAAARAGGKTAKSVRPILTFCDGEIGAFDVTLVPTKGDATIFELHVVPVKPGTRFRIKLASQRLEMRELKSGDAFGIEELRKHDVLVIEDPEDEDRAAVCKLELPPRSVDEVYRGRRLRQAGAGH